MQNKMLHVSIKVVRQTKYALNCTDGCLVPLQRSLTSSLEFNEFLRIIGDTREMIKQKGNLAVQNGNKFTNSISTL